jgi:septum formation protein
MASTLNETDKPLILASASSARAALLCAAGIAFEIHPAQIDEAVIKREFRDLGHEASACAMSLAEAKARVIAARYPKAVVIGADQILIAGDEWFDKPADLTDVAAQLWRLRGREHVLATAACAIQGDACLWRATATPKLTMRSFGAAFLARYIEDEGNTLLGSVGAYRIEGRGIQLFARIEGDHFSILGLPLLELLDFLRGHGLAGE